MHTLQSWFQGKISQPLRHIRTAASATEEWKRIACRSHYAKITLAVYPADDFSLASEPGAWQSEAERVEYEPYVLEGVLSELLYGPGRPVLGARFVVQSTVTHETDSNGNSFYQAARLATARILSGEDGTYRENCTD